MRHAEFPHIAQFMVKTKVPDGGGGHKETWVDYLSETAAFFDTPSSREQLIAMQTQNPLERYVYIPYRTDIKANMRVREIGPSGTTEEDEVYELMGRPMDQGGQREILRIALKRVVENG